MNRRDFIRLTSVAGAVGVIAPTTVLAGTGNMAGGLYYTKESPGRWSKKIAGHLPSIDITRREGDVKIKVVTGHEMLDYKHYIIKHVLLNKNFEFVAEKMFDPMKDKAPISEFELTGYSGKVHVLSVCNKHDTWLNSAMV